MLSPNVVLVEDDIDLAEEIGFYLQHQGMNVTTFSSGKLLDGWLKHNKCDVLILDLMLPGEDGLSIAKRLSVRADFRIVMLTSRVMTDDRISGFEAGADVYLNKPIHFTELVMVIRRLCQRLENAALPQWQLKTQLLLLIAPNGQQIKITTNETYFLCHLICAEKNYLTRYELEQKMWGISNAHTSRRLEVLVSRLRQKLPVTNDELIQTYRREGYGLIIPLNRIETEFDA
jgi:two-component system OmpR family response regulator